MGKESELQPNLFSEEEQNLGKNIGGDLTMGKQSLEVGSPEWAHSTMGLIKHTQDTEEKLSLQKQQNLRARYVTESERKILAEAEPITLKLVRTLYENVKNKLPSEMKPGGLIIRRDENKLDGFWIGYWNYVSEADKKLTDEFPADSNQRRIVMDMIDKIEAEMEEANSLPKTEDLNISHAAINTQTSLFENFEPGNFHSKPSVESTPIDNTQFKEEKEDWWKK